MTTFDPITQDPQERGQQVRDSYLDRMVREAMQPATGQEPVQAQGNPYLDRMLAEGQDGQQEREDAFLQTFRAAVRSNPSMAAEAQRIAQQLGVDPAAVESNLDVARAAAREQALRYRELQASHPILLDRLADFRFVRIAHDDVDNLKTTESTFGWLRRNWQAGSLTNERGYLGARRAAGLADDADLERLREIDQLLQENAADQTGFLAPATEVLGQMADTVPIALGAGALAAGTASAVSGPGAVVSGPSAFAAGAGTALFTQSALIEGGNAYNDMIASGYSHEAAAFSAFGVGVVNGALELVGAKIATAPVRKAFAREGAQELAQQLVRPTARRAWGQFVRDYAKGVAGEVGTELLQEVSNIAGDELARALGSDLQSRLATAEGRSEIADQLTEVASKTARAMALLGAPGPAARFVADSRRAQQAGTVQRKFLEAVAGAADASQVRQRDPEAYEGHVQEIARQNNVETLYVDGQQFAEVLRQNGLTPEQLGEQLPEVAEQVERAAATGDDVTIGTGAFAARLAGTDLGAALLPHLRIEPDAMSAAEAEQFQTAQKDLAGTATIENEQQRAAERAFVESAREVEEATRVQLLGTGQMPDVEARAVAGLYRAFVEVQAERAGVLPSEWQARYSVRVQAAPAASAGEVLNQDSDEFRAWFGESKVRDVEGKPLVVYHGSTESFDVFEAGEFGFHLGDEAAADMMGDARPVYLSLQNPLRMPDLGVWEPGKVLSTAHVRAKLPTAEVAAARAEVEQLGQELAERLDSDDPIEARRAHYEWSRPVRELLQRHGYDGFVYKNEAEGFADSYVAFESTQIKAVDNRGTFDPSDPNVLHAPDARGSFDPRRLLALLHESADASTALHEFAHAFLTIYTNEAGRPEAPVQVRDDVQTLLDWFGVESLDAWRKLTLDEQRQYHEQFAYSFEIYLHEGKAPSLDLQSWFDRFATWLRRVYRAIRDDLAAIYKREFGRDLPMLTDDVRSVFDRMLASEDEIAHAREVRGYVAAFQTQEESGMSAEQWAAYQQSLAEARESSVQELTTASLRQLQWLRGARSRVLKELQAKAAKAREQVRERVAAEVELEPVYRALAWLDRGELIDPTGARTNVEGSHKLHRESLHAIFPVNAPERRRAAARQMVSDDGVPPDVLAPLFGFESGQALVQAVLGAPSIDETIEQRTDVRMLEEHGELLDRDQREAAVERALHTEARARFVGIELRHLAKAAAPVRLLTKAARIAAQQRLERTPLRDIRPRQHSLAEGRAAKEARAAIRRDDTAGAADAKRKELLQHELAKQSRLALDEVEAALARFRRVWQSDEQLAKSRNVDLVNAARAILSYFGLGKGDRMPLDYVEQIKDYDPDAYEQLKPLIARAVAGAVHYRELPLADFRLLADTVRMLWHRAGRENSIEVDGRRMLREEAVADLVAQLAKSGIPDAVPGEMSAPTPKERRGFKLLNVRAALRRVEHWALAMDRGEPGPFTRYLWRPIKAGVDAYRQDKTRIVLRLRDLVRKLDLPPGQIDASRELGYVFTNKAQLLGALLHAGNESNLRKNLLARRWGTEREDGSLDASRWWRFIDAKIEDGTLTKTDFDFVQAVWDLLEEIKPLSQKAHRELHGFYFEEIEAQEIRTPWGVYRGGYVPAYPDRDRVVEAEQYARMEDLAADFRQAIPSTGRGHTIKRTDTVRGLNMDPTLLVRHVDEVLRFAHLQPRIRDVLSILRDRNFSGPLNRVDRSAINDMLLPWLNRTARQRVSEPGKVTAASDFFNFLRRNAGAAIMFGNVVNALQQITGIVNSTTQVRASFLRSALAEYLQKPGTVAAQIRGMSPFMDERLENQIAGLQDDLHEQLLDTTRLGSAQRWVTRNAYFLQRAVQNPVDITTWLGAFNQSLAEQGADRTDAEAQREAIARADAAVRLTQGSSDPEDLAAYAVGGPFYRIWIMFSGYWNTVLNQLLGARTVSQRTAIALRAFVIPTMVAGAIASALYGDDPDPEDDGYLDDALEWFVANMGRGALSMIPAFGPAAATAVESVVAAATDQPMRPGGDRLALSPAISTLEAAVRGARDGIKLLVEGGELKGRQVRDLLTLVAVATGLAPVAAAGKPLGYAADVARGAVEPSGAIDALRGAVTGRASEGTRR